jgi:Protein of unknown function (DUF4232)
MRTRTTRLATTLGALVLLAAACSPTPSLTPTTVPTPSAAPPTLVPTATPAHATASPAPTPTAAPAETSSGAAACTPANLKATRGQIEGAAGSRGTVVVLVSDITCSVDAFPALGLRDANGAILVGAASEGPGRINLDAGAAYASLVRIANWCADVPDFPLALEIVLGAGVVSVTGGSFPEEGDLPPCNGATGPILEAGGWAPAT